MRAAVAAAGLMLAAAVHAACPAPPRTVTERFLRADCAACWSMAGDAAGGQVLDWIVPAGADAALAAAALPEAAERSGTDSRRMHRLERPRDYSVRVADGIPVQGYIGVSLTVGTRLRRPPAGLSGYIALVENLAAGEEGSGVPRVLVRALIGPLNLAEVSRARPSTHRLATRVPDTPRLDRLGSVGWVEDAGGRMLAAAVSCPNPR